MADETRIERDLLGERAIPRDALWGIHTERALENFPLSGRPCRAALLRAFGSVKWAAARTNAALGVWSDDSSKRDAILAACEELHEGALLEALPVDALQGGAGTSTNMAVNEVLANRALVMLGQAPGEYGRISPHDDINRHQSTNDTYPTALKLAAIRALLELEKRVVELQQSFQRAEQRMEGIVKVARTQLQDAVLITLGREMSAYAEALGRDRWRIYKCEERLRVVNLGGTAVGTGLAAPTRYIFRVVDELRAVTGLGFARAENLVDATQNQDVFVEVSGILKAHAASLLKICGDLRLLASGPGAGLAELALPPRQAGSSVMPGKVNPVIPEAVSQVAMRVIANDQAITLACASGSLELNPYLPLVAEALLESLELLARANGLLAELVVEGLEANPARCAELAGNSVATVTALAAELGHARAEELARKAAESGATIRELALREGLLTEERFDALTSPEAVNRLGHRD